jgi:DNA-binding cell septation regulator SpoVG
VIDGNERLFAALEKKRKKKKMRRIVHFGLVV